MLKIRITFVENKNGIEELEQAKKILKKEFNVIQESKIYKGRGESQFSNIYYDVESK